MRDASCLVPSPFFCDHIVLLECFSEYFPANAHTLTDTRREKAGKTLYVADTEAHCIFEVDLEDNAVRGSWPTACLLLLRGGLATKE